MIARLMLQGQRVSYSRRQYFRRLSNAGVALALSTVAVLLAVVAGSVGAALLVSLFFVAAGALAVSARNWLVLAGRARVGARSEGEVRRTLAPLRSDRWRLWHSLSWRGRGDIDVVAIAPAYSDRMWSRHARGLAPAIEAETGHPASDMHVRAWARGLVQILSLVRKEPDRPGAIDAALDVLLHGWSPDAE